MVDERRRSRYGIFGKTVGRASPEDVGWWRYRVPCRSQLDWNRLIDTLYVGGYDGVVAVEHEDPVWAGSEERIKQGLGIAADLTSAKLVRTGWSGDGCEGVA